MTRGRGSPAPHGLLDPRWKLLPPPICADRRGPASDLPLLSVSFSSPKSKQEVMVRPPTVMSPSGNPQLDSKFSNQGKQGGSASQSQPSPCDSKSGGHTPKALPGPGGSMGLKNGAGSGAKGKGKRERSISADSFDQRDPGTPNDDSDLKGMSVRALRRGGTSVLPREGPWHR